MGLKKYGIVTVGGYNRVQALRSWQVGDRYVNIGDVGGIVYDEKTLSQDGLCWLFSGNFGFPGARISGDSIVDVGEVVPSTTGSPNVDILGSSVVVGSPVRFLSDQTAADAATLAAADFEQGTINYSAGVNWETWKTNSPDYLRTKAPIFMGGVSATLKVGVPGYAVQAYVLDRDGIGIAVTAPVDTGEGVTLTVPAGQYFVLCLSKRPVGGIVPGDATAAQIKFKWTYETKLDIVDSRLELNPANSTGIITIRPGGHPAMHVGAKYPNSVIRGSKVAINGNPTAGRTVRLMAEFTNVNVTIDSSTGDSNAMGVYNVVKNLTFSGIATASTGEAVRSVIQAYDCDNMVISPVNFPGLAAMYTAGVPIKFCGCNLIEGRFYHHAQIANTYRDIDFDLATKDLGKSTAKSEAVLVSSEVNGMYRINAISGSGFGGLVENHESVKSFSPAVVSATYGTTIYADAYLNGLFNLEGTNVFGNSMKHDASNTQNVLAVQGSFNANVSGQTITGIASNANRCAAPTRFRVNGSQGIIVNVPTGIECCTMFTDANGTILSVGAFATGTITPAAGNLKMAYVYLLFKKPGNGPITPDDVKGVTVTTYNGCKIVNTKATAAVIAGNVRVEDNATLIDVSVTGTGYFGGNSIIQAPSDLAGQLPIEGAAYMSDNAVFAPSAAHAKAGISLLEMKDNAVFTGAISNGATGYNITMTDGARCLGVITTLGDFVMRDNSFVAKFGNVVSTCRGLLAMKDNARIEGGNLVAIGYITLCGSYNQTGSKSWVGKRVIDSVDAPEYDNDVKTQYDF